MFKAGDDLRLTNHPVAQVFSDVGRVEDLDREETVEFTIFSEIDSAHTTARELFHERILRRAEIRLGNNAPQIVQLVV